jgi:YesN/AraC family two-component response regulator
MEGGSGPMQHVLIVDDSEPIRERLTALLAEIPRIQIVGQTGDGRQALEAVRVLKPDSVILDIQLPGRSGIELLKDIKARHPQVRVIMLTNHDEPGYRRQCKQLGADHFLNKTLEFDKIIDTILEPTAHLGKEHVMETFTNILVVSRSTKRCVKVLRVGITLARKFGAKLHMLHIPHDPFNLEGWNLPVPSLDAEYKDMLAKAKKDLDRLVAAEKDEGMHIDEWIKSGVPAEEIEKVVKSEGVDLILMLAHREDRLEHFLFGKTNDAIIRGLPATLMLVKDTEELK